MEKTYQYPHYSCQFCGSERKLVETVIDDEFVWSSTKQCFEPDNFSKEYEHTGTERCSLCKQEWTGLKE